MTTTEPRYRLATDSEIAGGDVRDFACTHGDEQCHERAVAVMDTSLGWWDGSALCPDHLIAEGVRDV